VKIYFLRICVKILLFLALMSGLPDCCASGPVEQKNRVGSIAQAENYPIGISLDVLARKYMTTDAIELHVKLKNKSCKDIYLQANGGWSTATTVKLKDHVSGKEVATSFIPHAMLPPPASTRDFIKISCHREIEEKMIISLRDFALRVGHHYDLILEYRSSVPKEMNFDLNIYSSEMRPVVSKPVVIEIVKN